MIPEMQQKNDLSAEHEAAHAVVAIRKGLRIKRIDMGVSPNAWKTHYDVEHAKQHPKCFMLFCAAGAAIDKRWHNEGLINDQEYSSSSEVDREQFAKYCHYFGHTQDETTSFDATVISVEELMQEERVKNAIDVLKSRLLDTCQKHTLMDSDKIYDIVKPILFPLD